MDRWLIKSDPEEYSASDLERERQTLWDGVRNALAQKHMRAMRTGQPVLVYHTGAERAVVAVGRVAGDPRPDPADPSGKAVCVPIAFERRLARPVPLTEIRQDPAFADFDLLRMSRLSVMPVGPTHWKRLLELARSSAKAGRKKP